MLCTIKVEQRAKGQPVETLNKNLAKPLSCVSMILIQTFTCGKLSKGCPFI